ncbi:MAG: hypothetical protein BWY76_02501 [bacterium ADurb.Bin429]|nr:MAG: hypothetical protein BWY76_02501 [bacterium ADurb.Bin429]
MHKCRDELHINFKSTRERYGAINHNIARAYWQAMASHLITERHMTAVIAREQLQVKLRRGSADEGDMTAT